MPLDSKSLMTDLTLSTSSRQTPKTILSSHRESCFREKYHEGWPLHVHFVWGWGVDLGYLNPTAPDSNVCLMTRVLPIGALPECDQAWIDNEDGAVFVDVVEFTS